MGMKAVWWLWIWVGKYVEESSRGLFKVSWCLPGEL